MPLRMPATWIYRLLSAVGCAGMIAAVPVAHAFQLDLSPKPPQTVEDEREQRYEQRRDCAAGKADARQCAMLEQQARQKQVDAVRRDTSPAGMPPPVNPDTLNRRDNPLSDGRE
ncbi:hypothetical protein [Cupriavidus sp. D384]|uniref:hypothetical protein n=1 Tax=Cupriavidus sp. D384 TaxID=1538095 RepID=UPI000AB4CF94|nr:hypothetical protein [Cupriavidus sp. D384]